MRASRVRFGMWWRDRRWNENGRCQNSICYLIEFSTVVGIAYQSKQSIFWWRPKEKKWTSHWCWLSSLACCCCSDGNSPRQLSALKATLRVNSAGPRFRIPYPWVMLDINEALNNNNLCKKVIRGVCFRTRKRKAGDKRGGKATNQNANKNFESRTKKWRSMDFHSTATTSTI